ncbi:MAG: sugar transferase [Deltaproteobacteria bacterium]|nr:sugar transferase [Deltaproteobacteria bacterium]
MAGVSFYLAYVIKIRLPGELASLGAISEYGWFFLTYLVLLFTSNYFQGFYTFGRTLTNGEIIAGVTKSNGLVMLNLMMVLFVLKVQTLSRLLFVMFAGINIIAGIFGKLFLKAVTGSFQQRGFNTVHALVIGTGEQAREIVAGIRNHPELGYRIVGLLNGDEKPHAEIADVPVLGTSADLHDILVRRRVDEVFYAKPLDDAGRLADMIWACEEIGIRFSLVTDFVRTSIAKSSVRYFLETPLLTFSTTPAAVGQLFIKAVIDRVFAGILLVALSPLLTAIAAAIKLSDGGPVFFTQRRCGLNGRLFTMFKFRTMVERAEQLKEELARYNEMSGPVFKMRNDPRVTRVGRILRRFSLDELPQLYNIFRGEMSFVGPRPPIPEEVERYERWQRRRLSMRPGLTCFWQISGRNEIDFDAWMRLDLKYIDNWSLKLDAIIVGKTIPVVLTGKGAS